MSNYREDTSDRRTQIPFPDLKWDSQINSIGDLECTVYKAFLWQQPVSVKVVSADLHQPSQRHSFLREVSVLQRLRHPNIVEFLGISSHQDIHCIVTEFLPLGKLSDSLYSRTRPLSWTRYFSFARDIASGLNWLHHKDIVFCELSPSRLYLSSDFRVKLGNFRLAHIFSQQGQRPLPSGDYPCYMAPEVLDREQEYGAKADVFSFGLVLHAMLYGSVNMLSPSLIIQGVRPQMPPGVPDDLQHLIASCLSHDPRRRPTIEQVIGMINQVATRILTTVDHALEIHDALHDLPPETRARVTESSLRLTELESRVASLQSVNSTLYSSLQATRTQIATNRQKNTTIAIDRENVCALRDERRRSVGLLRKKSKSRVSM